MLGPVLLQLANASEAEFSEDGPSDDDWQGVYAGMNLLEKIAHGLPALMVRPSDNEDEGLDDNALMVLWEVVSELCVYPHTWVRKVATRLVGFALSQPDGVACLLPEEERGKRAGLLALRMWIQFEECTDDEHFTMLLRVLIALTKFLTDKAPTAGQEEEQEADSDDEDKAQDDEEEDEGITLHGLLRRMSRIAGDKSFAKQKQRMAAMKWFAAVGKVLPEDRRPALLPLICKPLYQAIDGANMPSDGSANEVQQLAQEVLDALRESVGSEVLLAAYNQAREMVRSTRLERKKRKAQEAILDPELRALKKQKKTARKQVGKQRKLSEIKQKRSLGIPIKNRGAAGQKKRFGGGH